MTIRLFSNNAQTNLTVGIDNIITTLEVADGTIFSQPVTGQIEALTLEEGGTREIVHLTSRTGNTLTVIRGAEGTTALSFTTAANISGYVTAGFANSVLSGIDNQSDALGTNALAIQKQRGASSQTASGSDSIAIGNSAEASANFATSLGYLARAAGSSSIAIGYSPLANQTEATAIGSSALALHTAATCLRGGRSLFPFSLQGGGLSNPGQHPADFVGLELNATAPATIIPSTPYDLSGGIPWSSSLALHFGHIVAPSTPNGFQYIWADDAYPRDYDSAYTPSTINATEPAWNASHGGFVSQANGSFYGLNSTNYPISLPSNSRFLVTDIIVVLHAVSGLTVAPVINVGSIGSPSSIASSVTLSDLTARFNVQRISVTASSTVSDLQINVATPATATQMLCQFYFQGFLVADANFYA